jgi:hypothetical protein
VITIPGWLPARWQILCLSPFSCTSFIDYPANVAIISGMLALSL